MRQGQQNNNKRMRGRNRKGPNPLTRSYESNGGDVKIRGNALHVAEKYVQLARDAQSSGDRVAAENYLQHAEHYYRIVAAAQAQMPQPQQVYRNDEGDEEEGQENRTGPNGEQQPGQPQAVGSSDPQPYLNGNGQVENEDDDLDMGDNRFEPREMPQGFQQPRDNYVERDRGGYNHNNNQNQNRPNDHGGGGNYRGRRRRPFRERFDRDQQQPQQGGSENPPTPPASPAPPRTDE